MKKLKSAVFMSLMLIASTVFAHAHLITTIPAANAEVSTPPSTLALSFSEAIEPTFSKVSVTKDQQVINIKPLTVAANNAQQLIITPVQALSAGNYHVNWSVLSVDGHKTSGEYSFIIQTK